MRDLARLLVVPLALAGFALSGCSSGDDDRDGRAQIRLLNLSAGYDSLDMYAAPSGEDSDTLQFSSVKYGGISSYTSLDAGSYTFKFRRSGVASTLRTLTDELGADAYGAYLAHGSTGRFGVVEILENYGMPNSGRSWLQLFNTAEAGALDVYLTESSVSLDDALPIFANVSSASSTAGVTIDAGEYRLRVTRANDRSDLRLDAPSVTLGSEGVSSLLLTATPGGVLVNGALLPQRGDLMQFPNTKALVRAAIGVANGSFVSVRAGQVGLLTNAAVGVVGPYALVDAGVAPIALTIDGAPASTPDQTLAAGGVYTLAVWSDADGVRTTLISDDNRLPIGNGRSKLRIVNALSTMGVPLTLALDFSPIAEGVALGQSSDFTELDSGLEYQLDVTDSSTGANLLTRTGVSLQTAGVYTLFVSGAGATVNGTLRKDR